MLEKRFKKEKKYAKTYGVKLLKEYREKHKLDYTEMAALLGIPYTTYVDYEKKSKGMSFATQLHIMETLGITPDEWHHSIKKEFGKDLKIEMRKVVVRRPRGRPKKS